VQARITTLKLEGATTTLVGQNRRKHPQEHKSDFWRHACGIGHGKWAWEQLVKWLLVGCIVVVASGVFLWSNTRYDIDDAPITYRYAENIAAGNGFVYNIGERILGTSTPLYTLILATLRCLGISIPLASNVLNFLASVAVVAVTMALVRQLGASFWTALLAGAILLVQGAFLRYSMAGMETPVYTLLIVSSLLAFAEERTMCSAVLAALASLMRLDGLGVVVAILLSCLIQQRHLPLREMAVIALILSPWVFFASIYFGSPIPLSMLAKQQHLQAAQASRFWLWEHLFIRPLRGHMYLLPFMVFGVAWSFHKRSEFPKWLALMSWLGVYLIEYTLVGIVFYEWYLMPVYPALACFAAIGFIAILTVMNKNGRWTPLMRVSVAILVLTALIFPYVRHAYRHTAGYKEYLLSLEGSRVLAGTWLREHTSPESKIKTGAIGHVGYVSNRYVIDSAGLVTPPDLRTTLDPDYLVLSYPFENKWCGPVKDFETGWPFHPRLTISRCSEVKGVFDTLVLAEVRITDWVLGENGEWCKETQPYLETQWYLQTDSPERAWTLYVHFTHPDGTKVAQADHLLGLTVNGSVLPTSQWSTDQRVYDYVPLPEEVRGLTGQLEVRLGVWDPSSGERLEVEPAHADKDEYGRLVIRLS